MRNSDLEKKLSEIGRIFRIEGSLYSIITITNGNINSTYKMTYRRADGTVKSYVAQKINPYVFKHPSEIMKNIDLVTSHIRSNLAEGQVSLHFHHTEEGKNYHLDGDDGSFWRLYTYIPALSFNTCDSLEVLRNAGEAFGQFQMQLSDFDASLLFETIPDFHNTKKRLDSFFSHVEEDPLGRASEIADEIAYLREMAPIASRLSERLERKEIPLRVTHNDTKINNVLFDSKTKRGLVVIDLDTVMPGLAMYDFGDAVRFAANTAAEDEADLSLVSLDLDKYRAFAEGFIKYTKDSLTPEEIDTMALGALSITLELASRFLDDYLLGDRYFKVNYEGHNLVRARCQLHLAKDMADKLEKMQAIVREVAENHRGAPN